MKRVLDVRLGSKTEVLPLPRHVRSTLQERTSSCPGNCSRSIRLAIKPNGFAEALLPNGGPRRRRPVLCAGSERPFFL